jgi:uncharacterized membrane protein YoaK (UPF0700 family)
VPAEESVRVATLLSLAGGFLDAFTWVGHVGVFANAQTGNVVLLGVFAATGKWRAAWRHIPPILALVLGVFVAHGLRLDGARRGAHRVALFSLGVEIVLLLAVAALPAGFPDLPIVLGVAFVAALQSSSFSRVAGFAYSSVMTTGNLRRAAEGFFAGAAGDPAARAQARVFGSVVAMFGAGAAAGAFATERLGNGAALLPVAVLLVALLICRR